MKSALLTLLFITIYGAYGSYAQSNNALAFDGINDVVTVPAASALIANSSGLSLTAWVYPTNPAPVFPNFDGFAGFRNNSDADFYLLQYSATAVEARFTNSAGTVFSLNTQTLVLNAWTHLAFTYDGSMLRLYKNGVRVDSLPANGVITTAAENFLIGDQLYQGTHYYLSGKVDEISLWNRALQQSELVCMHINGIDTATASGLQLYYRCNQGIAGGTNTGQTTLVDAAGNINGTLSNFALTGNASNFVAGASLVTATVAFKCPDTTYTFNGTLLTAPGIYYDTLQNVAGCDSVVQLTLSNYSVDTLVIQTGATLTANHTGTYYQWLDCNNGFAPIAGATQKVFTATAIGSYAVVVLQGSCYDTSSCYSVTSVGLNNASAPADITVYPTASSSFVNINFNNSSGDVKLQLLDISGRVMTEESIAPTTLYSFDISRFARGTYQLLLLSDTRKPALFRVVRE